MPLGSIRLRQIAKKLLAVDIVAERHQCYIQDLYGWISGLAANAVQLIKSFIRPGATAGQGQFPA